jgi:4-amino-4-deoxy-L-arabinose transferase-like glycosyltransferase
MRNRHINGAVNERLPFFGWRLPAFPSAGRRLLVAAALLHFALAAGLFLAGRAQVAPGLIDRDGIMGSFAFDSYEYQRGAARLAEVLKREGFATWAGEREPVHVKLISIQFAILGPLFGHGPLSAEPFNLLCYLAVVGLTLALGREVGGARAGLIAAAFVALWPTFLLHTLQLLKDPLFIAGALALVLCVTTWLTRDYGPRGAIITGALAAVAISLILLVRFNFAVVIFAFALFSLALLAVRQLVERRPLYWNMACPVLILAAGVLLLPAHATRGGQKLKRYPSDGGGPPKAVGGDGIRVPTVVTYLPRSDPEARQSTYAGRFNEASHRMALRIGSVRYRFTAIYSESGSNIDPDVRFRDLKGLLLYLPRAFEIGCCAPFPKTWIAAGKRVGSAGKLLAGAETLVMYLFELLAVAAVVRPPRRLAAWLLLSITVFGVTLLGLVVPNVGALYRFRYTFWVLLIILGAKGFEAILALHERGLVPLEGKS